MEIKNVQANNLTTDYLNFCLSRKNLDQKTIKSYTIDLRQYFEFTMESAIEWTNKKSIEQYIDLLHCKYKPKSVKRKIASLKAFFALLRFEGPSAAAAAAPRRGAGAPSPSPSVTPCPLFVAARHLPPAGGSRPSRGSRHARKLCTSGANFPAVPKAPSQRELAKPSGFD